MSAFFHLCGVFLDGGDADVGCFFAHLPMHVAEFDEWILGYPQECLHIIEVGHRHGQTVVKLRKSIDDAFMTRRQSVVR